MHLQKSESDFLLDSKITATSSLFLGIDSLAKTIAPEELKIFSSQLCCGGGGGVEKGVPFIKLP